MSSTGDGRASWLTDSQARTTEHDKQAGGEAYPGTVTGDPRAAFLGAHAGEVEVAPKPQVAPAPGGPDEDISPQEQADIRRAIAESLNEAGETGAGGDGRANWLHADTAHGGRHNWEKKQPPAAPGPIQDPRKP